jgi:CRP/FNR family transcriptional regulator, cyclic AMP receptor protein
VLCRGHVKLSKVSSDGRSFLVRVAGPGDVVGLSATLSRSPYEVTAQALETIQTKTFRRSDFLKFLKHHAEGGLRAADSLNTEYRAALTDACRLALSGSIAGRIAHFLIQSAIEAGTDKNPHPVVHVPFTHEDLAAKLGSSRESITRTLNNLKRKGVIHVSGDRITILRKYALESIL